MRVLRPFTLLGAAAVLGCQDPGAAKDDPDVDTELRDTDVVVVHSDDTDTDAPVDTRVDDTDVPGDTDETEVTIETDVVEETDVPVETDAVEETDVTTETDPVVETDVTAETDPVVETDTTTDVPQETAWDSSDGWPDPDTTGCDSGIPGGWGEWCQCAYEACVEQGLQGCGWICNG